MEGQSTAGLVTGHAGTISSLCLVPSLLTDVTGLNAMGGKIMHKLNSLTMLMTSRDGDVLTWQNF